MTNPFKRFGDWYAEAKSHPSVADPTVMTLATATKTGSPSARIVLLKDFDERGFVFYTNLESRKSQELRENPHAALCFHWHPLAKQVRIEGTVEQVGDKEADVYFSGRPLMSRFGAIASKQSQPLAQREDFLNKIAELEKNYSVENPPPRPKNWSGWRVIPHAIEFWEEGEFRLHDRTLYTWDGKGWKVRKLYP